MKSSIRPAKGRRVRYVVYLQASEGSDFHKEEREGVVLGRVAYITRPSASSPKAYLNVRRDDGRKDRVDYYQLLGYTD